MSLSFNGDNNSYITIDSHTDFQVGTGEFTIEWFQYRTDDNPNTRIFQFGNFPNATLGVSIEGNMFYLWANKSFILNVDIGEHKNEWNHFAITRDANQRIRVFKNGVIIKTLLYSNAISPTENMFIGIEENYEDNDTSFGGYLTNFRFTKKALYTADFSTPIAPLFNTTETVLLILAHSAVINAVDYSTTPKTLNINEVFLNLESPFTSNVLSLTTNTSQSFVNEPEDPLDAMSPPIDKWKWNDFSSFNSKFILTNTTLSDNEIQFVRNNNPTAQQEIPQLRQLTNMTIYGWIKVIHTSTSTNVLSIITNSFEGEKTNGLHSLGFGDFRFRWDNVSSSNSDLTFTNDKWTFFAFTVNSSTSEAKLYLKDGTKNNTFTTTSNIVFDEDDFSINMSNLLIGYNPLSESSFRSFNGSMKTLQMFNALLSDDQIQEQYLLSGQQLGFINYSQLPSPYKIEIQYVQPLLIPSDLKTYLDQAVYIVENVVVQSHGHRENPNYDMIVELQLDELPVGAIAGSIIKTYHRINDPIKPDIPLKQNIAVNSTNLNTLLSQTTSFNGKSGQPKLVAVLVHEILHGLGIASFTNEEFMTPTDGDVGWERFLDNSELGQSWYIGPNPDDYTQSKAIMAYREITNNQYITRIPTENSFSEGTIHSHWEEGFNEQGSEWRYFNYEIENKIYGVFHPALPDEIMTGFSGSSQYFTKLTTGALEDYGYVVDNTNMYVVPYPEIRIQPPEELLVIPIISSQDWTIPNFVNSVEYAIIGGGGGGGGAHDRGGAGGGGAGFYKTGYVRVIGNNPYKIIIGEGGSRTIPVGEQKGNDGMLTFLGNIFAEGGEGGFGSRGSRNGLRSEGVKQEDNTRATSGTGGGGGKTGAGGGGVGGNGSFPNSATINSVGGAGILNSWNNELYGLGGAGGSIDDRIDGTDGTPNTGNGGIGGSSRSNSQSYGGAGGSGIVLVRYQKGILNDTILNYDLLQYETLNEFEEQLNPSEPSNINLVDFINQQITENRLSNNTKLNSLKNALKTYNNRLNTNKGIVQAQPFISLFSVISPNINLSNKQLLAITTIENQVVAIEPNEITQENTIIYLMNEVNDIVKISIENTIYHITILETGIQYNSTNYEIDEQFKLGNFNFIVRFTGSVGFEYLSEPFIPPFTPMNTETLTKKILNERTNQSVFSLLNHSSNRIIPQNNFLPTQSASSSDRLRKLKLQNHISANHR